VRGELLIGCGRIEAGEASLVQALAVAREHGARSLELRALSSLARRSADWLAPLRIVRSAITEGSDTVDLRRADALLAGTQQPAAMV
jgi:adenylate cyclase